VEVGYNFAMSAENNEHKEQLETQIVAIAVLVYTLDAGAKKPTCRSAALSPQHGRSVLNFIRHQLHGGRLKLDKLPDEQEKSLIVS